MNIGRIASMAGSRVKIGLLHSLKSNLKVDDATSSLPIFEGVNFVGRDDLAVTDKRVSRKHISLHGSSDGSVEVIVEGPNPIIFKSGSQKRKLASQDRCFIDDGDIVELIPGNHVLKYVKIDVGLTPPSGRILSFFDKHPKRSQQELLTNAAMLRSPQKESLTRTLQDLQNAKESGLPERSHSVVSKFGCSAVISKSVMFSSKSMEGALLSGFPTDRLSHVFRLMKVQGLPEWANKSAVAIDDVIEGNVFVAVLLNYMVDIDWLKIACPKLWEVPNVLVIHGESGIRVDHLQKKKPDNWTLHRPPLPISYGTHHSKAMLLIYQNGLRVIVHTANLIHVDWNNKTQGLWTQDFPWKDEINLSNSSPFEMDLIDYLKTLKWPDLSVKLPKFGDVNINASFFKKFDFSSSKVRLIASVPGYHAGLNLKKWGHMKMRTVLQDCVFDKEFCKSPLTYQFSSLGSLDEKWMSEFGASLSSGILDDNSLLGTGTSCIIWPTVQDVRCSLEGYAAGNAIPSPQKNVEKEFLRKYWARWKAEHVGRCRAMPHIKSYTRHNGQKLAWFLLTSANLSKAAWGALQKNNSQLMIRSYELGILFLPSTVDSSSMFSCTESSFSEQSNSNSMKSATNMKTKLVTLCWNGQKTDSSSLAIPLPIPYQLPPEPYSPEDVPWSWDRQYTEKDVYGRVWPQM